MNILATESLIIRVVEYNLTKLIKRDSTKRIIVGTVQFYPGKSSIFGIFDVWVLLTKFLCRS